MTLEQLRIFVAVAERQHVTQAARALNLAQSAASAAIAALEDRYQTALFHRVGRGITLTEAGHLFLVEAKAVLARADMAERALTELAGLQRGQLRVQASQTIASYWLPRHLVAFRERHSGVTLDLAIGNTAQVAAALLEGTADLGFVEGAVDGADLSAHQVALDQLVVVVAPHHPWAFREVVTAADMPETPWIMREQGSGTRSAFLAALAGLGVDPGRLRIALELPSNEAVRAAVEAGGGAAALSASVASGSIEVGLLHPVPLALPPRAFTLLRHGGRGLSRAASAFLGVMGRPDLA
ncbi:LysR family transcriptional regulator [Nitrospirillum iridis]|uniref:DNA-binding transcriptional LysR family regulator n=1 Tax=Nitrospirillum iridis TaxID=765888 RepID=A0A7X0AUX3_9PROT|nr:LysR family transcriptional regulator [Nitrospirillum iridis]MBB6250582.1 DNA-binding transcriptional LysR family regulator [Nitrospirillum iridis]